MILHFADVTNSDLLTFLIQITAYIVPFFLIPATFKFGMGVFGNLAGMVNDKSRGLFDRQRKYRQGKRAEGMQRFRSGTGIGRSRQIGLVRRTGMGIESGFQGRFGFGERGAQARSQIAGLAAQEQIMKHPRWSQVNENDDALHALTYRNHGEAVNGLMADRGWDRDRAERAAGAAAASVRFGRSQAIAAAQQLATTGTGYATHEDGLGNEVSAMEDQIRTIARASDGDKNSAAAIAGYNNFINKQKGRHDLAPGAGALIGAVHNSIDGYNTAAPTFARDMNRSAWNSGGLYQIANGKSEATKNLTNHWVSEYSAATTALAANPNDANARQQFEDATVAMQEMKAMLPNASGENQQVINGALDQMSTMREALNRHGAPAGAVNMNTGGLIAATERVASGRARTYERPDPNKIS